MKTALFIWGGWDGHQPKQCVDIIAPEIQKAGFEIVIADTLAVLEDLDKLQAFDLITPCWTGGTLTEPQETNITAAVKNGTGIAGWHGGMGDAFRSNTTYQFMTGGQWVAHPGNIIRYRVQIVNHHDPITQGMTDFAITSEQYYMHVDPGNDVLAATTFDGTDAPWIKCVTMPVVWKRFWGQGKVFYSSLGHVAKDFSIPQVKEITIRGLLWAAR